MGDVDNFQFVEQIQGHTSIHPGWMYNAVYNFAARQSRPLHKEALGAAAPVQHTKTDL